MKHVRLSELGQGTKVVKVKEGATLADVLAAAKSLGEGGVLTQNGRPASLHDTVKEDAHVMRIPSALHG